MDCLAKGIASKDALIYFLMSVCKIETLDSHIAYESERDVQDERIRILLWLTELDDKNNSIFRAEIASIAQRQLLLQGVQAVDKSRIYVDVEGVKTSVAKDLADLYSRFQNLPDSGGMNVSDLVLKLTETLSSKSGLVQFVVPKNERLAALREFFIAVRDRFVSSNEYGLDVYLSVGIRHPLGISHDRRGTCARAWDGSLFCFMCKDNIGVPPKLFGDDGDSWRNQGAN